MRVHRGVLNMVVFLVPGLIGAVLLGAVPMWHYGLPHPDHSDREELLRWLVTRDLANESESVQRALLTRIEAEFRGEADWGGVSGRMEPEHRAQLRENVPVLLRCWFKQRSDEFHRLPADKRLAYLDDVMATLALFGGVGQLCETPEPTSSSQNESGPEQLLCQFGPALKSWQAEGDRQTQAEVDELLLALRYRWMMQNWLGM